MKIAIALGVMMTAGVGCGGGPNSTDVTLAVPAAGTGFQMKVPAFSVAAGTETQACYFFKVPGAPTDEVWVDHYQIAQTPGSHHMNVFRVNTIKNLAPTADGSPVVNGECFISSNWSDWPLVVNSQQKSVIDWQLPATVGAKFHGGDQLMLQTHFVNATTQKTPGVAKVFVNFNYPKVTPQNELATLFATNQNIRACPGDMNKSFTKTCKFPSTGINIVAANGHFHSRGSKFEIMPVDAAGAVGQTFYTSTVWDDPPMTRDLNISLPAGSGIEWKCTYDVPAGDCGNMADMCCYTFGGHVDSQEHCNAFVYYWPKAQDINCF